MADPIAPTIRASFRKPFAEQVAAFRLRLGDLVPTARWDDIERSAHDRAFMVAGATKADLLADLAAAVDRSIAEGTGFEAFKRDFRGIVEKHGWHGWTGDTTDKARNWRMRVIYRTNMRTSYMAGRHAQLVEGNYKFWVYRHGGSLEPRPLHLSWDGLILPPGHPFWALHYPPNDWGCSCRAFGAHSIAGAKRRGGDPTVKLQSGWNRIDPKTGAPPGIGKGWDYAPGASVARTVATIADKVARLPSPIGADLLNSWPDRFFTAWTDVFGEFVDEVLPDLGRGRSMIVGALKPKWVDAARARGVQPATAEIAVTDKAIHHTFRDAKKFQLDRAWYRALPQHLRKPDLVLLDTTRAEPAMILLIDLPGGEAKLVIHVNYRLKKVGMLNLVETGRIISNEDIRSMIGIGLQIVEGRLGA